ncbi:uncharacterized protein LOC128548127 [Mercenaria mercenaria]|uniref:uncharacterized protein LOC128548127 n=1 Tax=Mercenaria mercenaria TaxID=6596 RepID=UPI00234F2285|nr:uncharacterized protein LOC128548127 [Mercenaria mercenaria]
MDSSTASNDETKKAASNDETKKAARCSYCSTKERVTNVYILKKGNHICFGGQYHLKNIGDRQKAAYNHHAIVYEVKPLNSFEAVIELIHFSSTPFDAELEIQQTWEMIDLKFKEVYIVRYRHSTNSVDKIIQNAVKMIGNHGKYSILWFNCEHFCNWCCVSTEECLQINSIIDKLQSFLAGAGNSSGSIFKVLLKFFLLSVDDISIPKACTWKLNCITHAPWCVSLISAVVFLIWAIVRQRKLKTMVARGQICSSCYQKNRNTLWMKFFLFCALQSSGLAIITVLLGCASKGIVAAAAVVGSLVSLIVVIAIPKLCNLFLSPFKGCLRKVTDIDDISVGDVISFNYWKMSHDGIVSSIVYQETKNGSGIESKQKGKVTLIHYSRRRVIVEEMINVDFSQDSIFLHDYSGYRVHEPEIVVQRARKRLNERRYRFISNRSCHFCHWAKVNEDMAAEVIGSDEDSQCLFYESELDLEQSLLSKSTSTTLQPNNTTEEEQPMKVRPLHVNHSKDKKPSSKVIARSPVWIRDDLKEGEIFECRSLILNQKYVATYVRFDNDETSKIYVKFVHVGKNKIIREEEKVFDLHTCDVWVYKYHPLYCYKKADIVRRARSRIGEYWNKTTFYKSSNLATDIVVKHNDSVKDMDDIRPGDVISYKYWKIMHDAIVITVEICDSKLNDTGNLTIVHYGLTHPFATRTVIEETISVDLKTDIIILKAFEECVTYPSDTVIKRARSRIGEQRFSINKNRSTDLVKWAKLVQVPSLVYISKTGNEDLATSEVERYALLPKVGDICENFQRIVVYAWSDLYVGALVEYPYYTIMHQGIISYVNEKEKTIKWIHYGTSHIFATRTIIEEELKLDLRFDNIYIYRGHPGYCNKPSITLQKARKRLGEQNWGRGNRSWDFCKACVIKYPKFQRTGVHSWSDLYAGACVEFPYYKILHQGIISSVNEEEQKIDVIHYGTDHILATRTIIEEKIQVRFGKVWIYQGQPEYCNEPNIILQKARDRLGEQKWGKENRSSDFCKACVMKYPKLRHKVTLQ